MNTPKNENMRGEKARNTDKKSDWGGNMLKRTHFQPENIALADVAAMLPEAQRERIISGYDIKNFARIFEDPDIMDTAENFLKYGMNVSETSRRLYMHRNTLIYRLNKIQNVTGLDIRVFDMAVTFVILRSLYAIKRGEN